MYFDDCFTQKYLIPSDPLFGSFCIVAWKSPVTERIQGKTTKYFNFSHGIIHRLFYEYIR